VTADCQKEVLLAVCWWGYWEIFLFELKCVIGFRNTGITGEGGGGGGYRFSLPRYTASSHSLPLLSASELRSGCFGMLTLSRKTATPEKIFGMFTALQPIS